MLKAASNQQAFLKAGIMGFAGSGKTHTGAKIATGLHKHINSAKAIAFLDTETGSDFVLPMFEKAGIKLLTAKSRAFVDLLEVVKESEKTCDILIIDSISHFWTELMDAYQTKLKRTRLKLQDWGPIKQEWRSFTDLYLNSHLHIIMNGRAGWEYDFHTDEETGQTDVAKSGTKMKAETEMGYEPSLLIEMEKVRQGEGKIGQAFTHRAWVLKDRFDVINGKSFDNPGFESFLPHIRLLNIGGEHIGVDTSANSEGLFDSLEGRSNIHKRREIAIENLQNEILKRIPGRAAADQKAKLAILEDLFDTGAWTAISEMHPDRLENALIKLKQNYPVEA